MADAAAEASVPPVAAAAPETASDPTMSGALPADEGSKATEEVEGGGKPAKEVAEGSEQAGAGEAKKESKEGDVTEGEPKEEAKREDRDRLRHSDWRELRDKERNGDRYSSNRRGHNDRRRPEDRERDRKKEMRKNIKSDFSNLKESSDPGAIRKQVEFYFSDSNLPNDAFLLGKVDGTKNNPVEISVIHSFKRMRHFQPFSAVVAALKDSELLEVVDDDKVKRKTPLPENLFNEEGRVSKEKWEDMTRARSIYAKGFGEEVPSTQFDIEAFFAPYGPTNAIRLRRKQQNLQFKGSVFVEFENEETAKAFLDLENKPKWDGKELIVMSKEDYVNMKEKDNTQYNRYTDEYADDKANQERKRSSYKGGRGGHSQGRGRGKDHGHNRYGRYHDSDKRESDRHDSSKRKRDDDTESKDEPKKPKHGNGARRSGSSYHANVRRLAKTDPEMAELAERRPHSRYSDSYHERNRF